MNWLNPVNWFRAAAASALEKKIDEWLTVDNGRKLIVEAVNKALDSAEWWNDARCSKVARGLSHAAKSMQSLAADEELRKKACRSVKAVSPEELKELEGDVMAAFGDVVTEDIAADWRKKLKEFVRDKIGI